MYILLDLPEILLDNPHSNIFDSLKCLEFRRTPHRVIIPSTSIISYRLNHASPKPVKNYNSMISQIWGILPLVVVYLSKKEQEIHSFEFPIKPKKLVNIIVSSITQWMRWYHPNLFRPIPEIPLTCEKLDSEKKWKSERNKRDIL